VGVVDIAAVEAGLRQQLPLYMQPSLVVLLPLGLPTNSSGKTDERALPEPDWAVMGGSGKAQAEGPFGHHSSTAGAGPTAPQGAATAAPPAPAAASVSGSSAALAQLQQQLSLIWQQVLMLECAPEADDDFWAIGGNSLLAGVMLSKVGGR
jgi:hypothetical protein